jgi:hypothetical protein
VQRWWPVLLPVDAMDQFGNSKESFPTDVKVTAEDGPLSQQFMLQVAGVGEYKFRLNDSRRPWAQQTVVFSELQVIDPSLWTLHPPIIDPKRLDLEAKRNQAYIKFARAHGYLPHEGAVEKEQADMATETVLTQLLQQNKQLTDQVISKPAAAPAPTPQPKSENGDGGALRAMADVVTAALNRPQPAAPPAADPMAMVHGIAGVVHTLMPKPDTASSDLAKEVVKESAAANERVFKMQESALNELRQQVKDAHTTAVVAPVAPRSDVDILEEAVKKQNLVKQLTGRASAAEEESKPSNIDKWLDAMPFIQPIAQSLIGGIFQTIHFGFQTWQTISYNNALSKNGGEPKAPTTMDKPPEPGKPIQPQGPPPTPEQQAQAQQMPLILQGVAKLIGPLQRALNNSKTGDEFAESMIDFTEDGRADYDKVRNVAETLTRIGMQVPGEPGVEQFKQAAGFLFQQFPAFYQKVATLPTFGVFLEEFYDYDKIAAEKQQQEQK